MERSHIRAAKLLQRLLEEVNQEVVRETEVHLRHHKALQHTERVKYS